MPQIEHPEMKTSMHEMRNTQKWSSVEAELRKLEAMAEKHPEHGQSAGYTSKKMSSQNPTLCIYIGTHAVKELKICVILKNNFS